MLTFRRSLLPALALISAVAGNARAQMSPEPSSVDAVRGTIKGRTRYIGRGGAFVAIADDTEGVAIACRTLGMRSASPSVSSKFTANFGLLQAGIELAPRSARDARDIENPSRHRKTPPFCLEAA
jgi:hypothetical protein